jgi:hypothetical protein
MKAIYYIVMDLIDIFYIVYTSVSLTWFENVPLPLLTIYIIKKNTVLTYLCACSLTYIKIKLIIYQGKCLNRVIIRSISKYLSEDGFDHLIQYMNKILMSVPLFFNYVNAIEYLLLLVDNGLVCLA